MSSKISSMYKALKKLFWLKSSTLNYFKYFEKLPLGQCKPSRRRARSWWRRARLGRGCRPCSSTCPSRWGTIRVRPNRSSGIAKPLPCMTVKHQMAQVNLSSHKTFDGPTIYAYDLKYESRLPLLKVWVDRCNSYFSGSCPDSSRWCSCPFVASSFPENQTSWIDH